MLPNKLLRPWLRAAVAAPGPLIDVTDPHLLQVSGVAFARPAHPLLVPGVAVELTAGWFGAAAARLLPGHRLVHPEDVLAGRTVVQAVLEADHDAQAALRNATLAAGDVLGWSISSHGDGVLVDDVAGSLQGGLSDGLRPGDVVVACQGRDVSCLTDLRAALARHRPGAIVSLDVLPHRGTATTRRAVVAAGRDGTPRLGVVALTLNPRLRGPVHVELLDPDAGGPSAGLGIALALLAGCGGLVTAGPFLVTGEVGPDGLVHPVGGIADKARSGARAGLGTMVLPAGNADQAAAVVAAGLLPLLVTDLEDAARAVSARPWARPS